LVTVPASADGLPPVDGFRCAMLLAELGRWQRGLPGPRAQAAIPGFPCHGQGKGRRCGDRPPNIGFIQIPPRGASRGLPSTLIGSRGRSGRG